MSSPFDVAASPLGVVVAGDGPTISAALDEALRRDGLSVARFSTLEEALASGGDEVDALVTGLRMNGFAGAEVLRAAKARWSHVEVILTCPAPFAPEAARAGAFAHLITPLEDLDGTVRTVRQAAERKRLLERVRELEGRLAGPGEESNEADPGALAALSYADARRLAVRAFERRYLSDVLSRANGNITAAARAAGMDRSNFRRALKSSGLRAPKAPAGEAQREDEA